jgi:transposase
MPLPHPSLAAPVLPFTLPGSVIDTVWSTDAALLIEAQTTDRSPRCPACGQPSVRVHSHYVRRLRDLPVADRPVHVRLRVRRFWCDAPTCPQRTFAERLPDLAPLRARRTPRLTEALCAIGSVAGGEAGARLATRLQMATSGDTLLRLLRAIPPAEDASLPIVIGIDDFALRKGRTYGTLLVDLEHCRVIDLLPERTAESVAARLRALPNLTVVARDRSQEYARAVRAGAPQATQVADRFHLLSSLRKAVERYMHRVRPELRRVLLDPSRETPSAAAAVDAAELDAPPPPRYDPGPARRQVQTAKHAERQRRFQQVKAAQARGLNQHQIVRLTGLFRPTVRWWMTADVLPPERRGYRRGGKVEPYGPYLLQRLAEGCTNQTRLWQEITAQGFVGTRSLVAKWIRAHRQGLPAPAAARLPPLPGPQALAWLVFHATEESLAEDDRSLWERLQPCEELVWVQGMVTGFATMVRERLVGAFDQWLADCRAGPVPELRNFAVGLEKDGDAVRAALTLPWSNGPTEGHINKLKLLKRAAFGRMKLDLLRQRMLHAA